MTEPYHEMLKRSSERNEKMKALRAEGYTYTSIAKQFGISYGRAWQICNKHLAAQREAEAKRDRETERLLRASVRLMYVRSNFGVFQGPPCLHRFEVVRPDYIPPNTRGVVLLVDKESGGTVGSCGFTSIDWPECVTVLDPRSSLAVRAEIKSLGSSKWGWGRTG